MKVLAGLLAALALLVSPHSAEAATSTNDLEGDLRDLVNEARTDRGLKPLRGSGKLWIVAGYRASRLARTNILSHSIAGNIGSQLKARNMPWYAYGEDIGWTRAKRGNAAIKDLFRMWKNSPSHWKLMMSSKYNYIGVGIAYRGSKTFSSLIFTESRDMTDPRSSMRGASVSDDDIHWSWSGYDPMLQSHFAGFRSFDVQTRTDWGSWRTTLSKTTATTANWSDRSSGHSYAMRVRARDRAGNVSAWSREMRVRVP